MVDHREFKGPGEAQAKAKSFEKAENNTRWIWRFGFVVLIIAGIALAFYK
jgi:hypothetical protein